MNLPNSPSDHNLISRPRCYLPVVPLFSEERGQLSTMTRSRKHKNAARYSCPLSSRDVAASQMKVTTDFKTATVQSVLFKFSAVFSDPWNEGYPVKTVADKQYILQAVRNSSPFVVDLMCFQRNEGERRAIGTLVQSFQFPSPTHNLSVCNYTCISCSFAYF